MAKPTKKSKVINDLCNIITGNDREQSITNDVCAICGKPATEFKDALSKKEFSISGMCQICQDKVFD